VIPNRSLLAAVLSSAIAFSACSNNGGVSVATEADQDPAPAVDESAVEPEVLDETAPDQDPAPAVDESAVEPEVLDETPEVLDETAVADDELTRARAYLDNDFIDTFGDDDADCIVIEMVDNLGLARLAELDANGGPIDQGDVDALLDSMYACVDATDLGTMLTAEMAGGNFAIPAEARDCVVAGYGERTTVEALLTAGFAADGPDAGLAGDAARAAIAPLIDCIGFGGLMQQEAAADGVTLGEETIACLDDQGNDLFTDVVGGMLAGGTPLSGGDAQQEMVALLLGCLSADEMAQMSN
jgi:hypothetical protein